MHSFHQSRGRILFEVLCALAISVSFVGAWMQTGASALLPAAAVTLLYGLVHAVDVAGRRSVGADPQPVEISAKPQVDVTAPADHLVTVEEGAELPEEAPLPARKARQPKAPRKAGGRSAGTLREPKGITLVPPKKTPAAAAEPEAVEETAHASLPPLFEAEPFVRQQRAIFGRKAG